MNEVRRQADEDAAWRAAVDEYEAWQASVRREMARRAANEQRTRPAPEELVRRVPRAGERRQHPEAEG